MRNLTSILLLAACLLTGVPAYAQIGCFGATNAIDCSWGPTLPALEFTPGDTHPVSIPAGLGLRLSIGLPQTEKILAGKSWQIISLAGQAYGSIINTTGGSNFGKLSAALGLGFMSDLVGVSVGHGLVDSTGGWGGRWFVLLSLGFNFGLLESSGVANVVQEHRANTVLF